MFSEHNLGDALFPKTRQRVLGLLFRNPGQSYFLNEIARHCNLGKGTVQRELENLTRAGILSVQQQGNQKHYQTNPDCPIFDELNSLVRKTFGVADVLRAALETIRNQIVTAFIYGSVAKETESAGSDIDILVVADALSYGELFSIVSPLEQQLGRQVSPTLYTLSEFNEKLAAGHHFVQRVWQQPKIFLMGGEDDLGEPGGGASA